jgi:monovalent cation/hydrogen antiporter
VIAAVIVTRFIWILPATYLPRALSPALRRRDPYPPFGVPESWAGMRGAPLNRGLGLSGFTQDRPKTLSEAEARAQMAAAQLTEVEQRSAGEGDARRHPRLLEQ